jgi:hypothetical protein
MIYAVILLSLMLVVSIFYCIKFAIIIISIQQNIEQSLEILDEKYEKINEILQIPIFHDSREIRQVLDDIKDARQAVVDVAEKLSLQELEEEEM